MKIEEVRQYFSLPSRISVTCVADIWGRPVQSGHLLGTVWHGDCMTSQVLDEGLCYYLCLLTWDSHHKLIAITVSWMQTWCPTTLKCSAENARSLMSHWELVCERAGWTESVPSPTMSWQTLDSRLFCFQMCLMLILGYFQSRPMINI